MTRSLTVTTKTGFRITHPEYPVNIRDCRGVLFYTTEPQVPRIHEFNLPQGRYLVDSGHFKPMAAPVDYPLKKLPPRERDRPVPYNFKLIWGDNPNKCTVVWSNTPYMGQPKPYPEIPLKQFILFDKSLEDYRLPELYFILYHEYGHAKYKTEKFCDLDAYNRMIVKGFNPTQIGMAQIDSLSSEQERRKQFLVNVITNEKFDER